MSIGRGGGRGGRGGGGGGGAGRGALADLSLGTLSFADLLATSRADIGGVLYPTTDIPVTDLPSTQEAQTVDLEVDRWIYPTHPTSRRRWLVDGVIKPNMNATKKIKNNRTTSSLPKPFIHRFSELVVQNKPTSSENWLYSDRYESNPINQDNPDTNNPTNQYKFLHLLEKSFFPPELWTSFSEGKKKIIRKTKSKKSTGQVGLSGIMEDEDGQEEGDGEKDDKEEEAELVEEEEIDEDDPDYDNNYFDNGDDDEGMDSGGDEGGVF